MNFYRKIKTWVDDHQKSALPKSDWFNTKTMQVYLRVFRGKITISRVTVENQGKGQFTQVLKLLQRTGMIVHIESVVNDRFAMYFKKRGWKQIGADDECPDFERVPA